MLGRFKRLSPRAGATMTAVALLAGPGISCGSSGGGRPSSTSAATTSASSLAPIQGNYSPSIDPANFVATVNNRYWPLKPGTAFHYRGVRGTTPQPDDDLVPPQTKR